MSGGGFGSGPFGGSYFGEWDWSLFSFIDAVPEVYKDDSDANGAGTLRALLEGIAPSLDGLRHKIRDFDDLRDPLKAPVDTDFLVSQTILRTVNQGDGTSIVFLSEGPDGDRFNGVRPGMVLTDLAGNRFTIESVHASALAFEVDDPPTDPATGLSTGRHVVVSNVGQSNIEIIPFVSGTLVSNESPSPVGSVGTVTAIPAASIADGDTLTLSDGVHPVSVFEFDGTPSGTSTLGSIRVDIDGLTTAIEVASALVTAINAAPNLNLTASNGSGTLSVVTITNFGAGIAGDVSWSTTNGSIVIVNPTGGAAGAFPLDPLGIDDGVSTGPYVFNALASYDPPVPPNLDLAPNRITIRWTEGGSPKTGFFTADGRPGGDLDDLSALDRSASATATGQFRLFTDSGLPIDADSLTLSYTSSPAVLVADADVRAQNILAFLAGDYGIKLDRNDPEFLQRSYVNNAFKIWDIKGTELGYDVIGRYAGYFVSVQGLYSINPQVAATLPSFDVYELPAGSPATGTISAVTAASIVEGETFTLDDGVNTPVVFEFDTDATIDIDRVAVDISAAVSSNDVASAIVSAINGAVSLGLIATNDSGATPVVRISNGTNGIVGNLETWTDTVADSGFAITQPTGGVDSDLFTPIAPGRALFDDVSADALPLDILCSDASFPSTVQVVTATAAQIRTEGARTRSSVTVTVTDMWNSFGTEGVFTDASSVEFGVQHFARTSANAYTFEVVGIGVPANGVGQVEWNALKFEAPNTVTIAAPDVVDLGVQYAGYTGHRYRITQPFVDPILAAVGNWSFIDSAGVVSSIEAFKSVDGGYYEFDIVSGTPPTIGSGNIFLNCEISTYCGFCRSSSLLIRMNPEAIINYPDALAGDALGRMIIRLQQMIPAHVRIASFLYDPGPAVATWGTIEASSFITEEPADDVPVMATFDTGGYEADEEILDSGPMDATSEVTITNQNVLEEFIDGSDPLVSGAWTATGLWHITEYRSSTQFRSFSYGKDDVGQMGDVGAIQPNYDTGAISSGTLRSPTLSIAAATTVNLKFRHFGDMLPAGDDVVSVLVVDETGPSTVQTISKTDLGLIATGTNGGFTSFSVNIGPAVVGNGNFHLEFVFNSTSSTALRAGEGWYIDDVEIQVIP